MGDYQDDDFYDENFDSYPSSPVARRRNNNQEEEEEERNYRNHHHNNNNNNDNDAREQDDEQVQQKLNERIEMLAQRVEELESELEEERSRSLQVAHKYEQEIKLAWSSQRKAEEQASHAAAQTAQAEDSLVQELKREMSRYRLENEQLKDKVELLLLTQDEHLHEHNDDESEQTDQHLLLLGKQQGDKSKGNNNNNNNKGDSVSLSSTPRHSLNQHQQQQQQQHSHQSVPHSLEAEFQKYCRQQGVFTDLCERHLSAEDCVRILQHASEQQRSQGDMLRSSSSTGSGAAAVKKKKKSKKAVQEEEENIDDLTAELLSAQESEKDQEKGKARKLVDRIKAFELELRAASMACDSDHMKQKVFQLSERVRVEKEHKRQLENDLSASRKKIEMLSDHIEKLVTHLKREGAHKVRLAEQLRNSEREGQRIREKAEIIQRKSSAKDRLILELREGSKVLEDQLRLMDEKYLELRGKLDYTRGMAWKKIKKAEKDAADLRVKFVMSGNSQLLLDTSSSSLMRNSQSQPMMLGGNNTNHFEDFDADSWSSDNNNNLGPPRYQHYQSGADSPSHQFQRGSATQSRGNKDKISGMHISFDSGLQQPSRASTRRSEPSMDIVLEKIRIQSGSQQVWTEEKAKKLITNKR